ncbi:ABC transporter permease [Catenulispora yoronensis]
MVPCGSPDVQDRQQFADAQASGVDVVLTISYVLLVLAIVIALAGIANTLALSVHERTRELGLLRAVGLTRRQARSLVRWESLLVALFGTLGGVALGTFLGWTLVRAASSSTAIAFAASPPILLLILAAGAAAACSPPPARAGPPGSTCWRPSGRSDRRGTGVAGTGVAGVTGAGPRTRPADPEGCPPAASVRQPALSRSRAGAATPRRPTRRARPGCRIRGPATDR